jgi:chorismate-pyruvate lyase
MDESRITAAASAAHQEAARKLASPFCESLGEITPVGYANLPADYQTLLAHSGHMTVTLEAWHEALVDVKVIAEAFAGDIYARHSVLTRRSDGQVVQSGVMQISLAELPAGVREAVELGECPLGRILIRSNLLREVELLALWRIDAGVTLAEELPIEKNEVIYGRSARILVEGRPAVELLEIVKP